MKARRRPSASGAVVEHFDGSSRRAQHIVVWATLVLGAGTGAAFLLLGLVPSSDPTAADVVAAIVTLAFCVAPAWLFCRMRLELRTDEDGFTARVVPFRAVRVDPDTVVSAEIVEVRPYEEFGGWCHRGFRDDRLLGGTGRTGLRVTYLLDGGTRYPQRCRLTLLSGHAENVLEVLRRANPALRPGP